MRFVAHLGAWCAASCLHFLPVLMCIFLNAARSVSSEGLNSAINRPRFWHSSIANRLCCFLLKRLPITAVQTIGDARNQVNFAHKKTAHGLYSVAVGTQVFKKSHLRIAKVGSSKRCVPFLISKPFVISAESGTAHRTKHHTAYIPNCAAS
jgi:hypothetical protein